MARSEAAAAPSPAEAWWRNSFMVTFHFRCNIACRFCMVEDVLGVLPGTTLDEMRRLKDDPARLNGASRIIFSGGEVTLSRDLVDYVRLARTLPGIAHVRLQTNAMRLGDPAYLGALLDAGVDEFFVSLHAATAPDYDDLVQRSGAFASICKGLDALAASPATIITNTAIVDANYRSLPAIVELATRWSPQSMEFWNYWPRADEDGARGHHAAVGASRPYLLAALAACARRGVPPVVKWYPRCLLGPFALYHDDGQPPSIIDESYWEREPGFGCVYDGVCKEAERACSGLSESYVAQYGWEERLLTPHRPDRSNDRSNVHAVERSLLSDRGPERLDTAILAGWLAGLGLGFGVTIGDWVLADGALGIGSVALQLVRGTEQIQLQIRPNDPSRPSLARTASFDLAGGSSGQAAAKALAAELRDPGGLGLP